MTNLNEMFAATTNATVVPANARSLAGTAQLTQVAADLATNALNIINNDAETYGTMVKASMTDHDAMDTMLNKVCEYEKVDIKFLTDLDSAELDKMLKSQQSKRSRSKGKAMTKDNYMTLMTGAIAENLLRMAMGKEKQSGGRAVGNVSYTDAELQELANDQDKLRKVLRNIQSKKSIMKSKEGFSETDERWLELLAAEEQLKDIRTEGVVRVDKTKLALRELFDIQATSEKPLDKMSKTELLRFIEKVAGLCADPVNEEAEEAEKTEEIPNA